MWQPRDSPALSTSFGSTPMSNIFSATFQLPLMAALCSIVSPLAFFRRILFLSLSSAGVRGLEVEEEELEVDTRAGDDRRAPTLEAEEVEVEVEEVEALAGALGPLTTWRGARGGDVSGEEQSTPEKEGAF